MTFTFTLKVWFCYCWDKHTQKHSCSLFWKTNQHYNLQYKYLLLNYSSLPNVQTLKL